MLIHEFESKLIWCYPQNHVLQSDNGLSNSQAQRLTKSKFSVKNSKYLKPEFDLKIFRNY